MSRTTDRLSRGRRIVVFLSSAFLCAVLAVVFLWLPRHIRGIALGELTSVFGRTVTADQIHLRLMPLELDIRDLRVAGLHVGDPPALEVARLLVVPSVTWLWERRLVLSRVHIERPTIRIEAAGEGSDTGTVPALGPLASAGGIRIRRLSIDRGALLIEHRRIPLTLDLPEVDTRLTGRRGGALAGQLTFGPGAARFGDAPPLPIAATFEVQWAAGTLNIASGRVRAGRSDVAVVGDLRVSTTPHGHIKTDGIIDLEELDRHVIETGFALAGTARHAADIRIDGSQVSLEGHFDGRGGSWRGAEVPRFAGDLAWSGAGIRIRNLSMDVLGGEARLDLDIPPAGGAARASGHVERVDAEKTVARLFAVDTARIGAAATGDIELVWPRGRFRDVTGRAHLALSGLDDGRTSVHGTFDWEAEAGAQRLRQLDLVTKDQQLSLRGRIARDRSVDLEVALRSGDLAAGDELGERVRRALGDPQATRFGAAGRGVFDGRWRGMLGAPVYEGRFAGDDVEYLGVGWGHVEWSGRASEREIASSSLVLQKGPSQLSMSGRMEPGRRAGHDAVDMRVRFTRWPAEDLVRALEWKVSWSGLVSGEAEMAGRRSAPRGRVALSGEAGRYQRVAYDTLQIDALLQGDRTEVQKGHATLGGGEVQFAGTMTDAGVYDGTMTAQTVDLGAVIPPVGRGIAVGGHVSGDLAFTGTLVAPRLTGHFTAPRLFLGDEGMGAFDANVTGAGDGTVAFDAHLASPRIQAALQGRIGATLPYDADIGLQMTATSLDPLVRLALPPDAPNPPGIVASGRLALRGPLSRPLEVAVDADLADAQVLIPEYPVHNVGALHATLSEGRVALRDVHLAGEGTNLTAGGEAAVLREGPVDLDLRGAADLRSLAAITRRLRARGDAVLSLKLGGTRDAPTMNGELELKGAGVRVRDFPHGLEEVHGVVQFTERAAQLKDVVGQLGGGEVSVEGQATYGRSGLASVDLSLSGRDIALRYPEGMRSVSNADLRIFGDGETQWVTGNVDVRQAVWTRRYDVASELLTGEKLTDTTMPFREGVHFDVTVNAPGTLKLDNNLGALEASADLRLQGTSDNPILLGRAEIEHGRVYFQGNTYVIRRGRIDFSNPQRFDPFFDIEAETRLRSYRVNLKMAGTLERVYPTLTSDPPLSAVQILSLLAGADEQDVASVTAAQTNQLAATGAATLAAGRLSEEFGLERNAERFFGLNRFSIDPSVFKNGVKNPTARLTVGKRITPDLNVLYSVDLHGSDERLLSVEYVMSEIPQLAGVLILLTSAAPGGVGFDVRVQHSR